jgi:hypothetical protein
MKHLSFSKLPSSNGARWPPTDNMAKSKALIISGPMDAKHVGGVNVMGGIQPSGIDKYFDLRPIVPDERPSHTFVATNRTEVPRRSESLANTIRRPSLSIKRSFSKLRRRSISHAPELQQPLEVKKKTEISVSRTVSARSQRPLTAQSSLSHVRKPVGLDKDLHAIILAPHALSQELLVTAPTQAKIPDLQTRRLISRSSSRPTSASREPQLPVASQFMQQQPSPVQRKTTLLQERQPSFSRKLVSPPVYAPATVEKKPPTKPQRVDSGTAINLKSLSNDERPLGFQEILAVRGFEDRMVHYERARQYWAHADHGLGDWNQAFARPRRVATRI